MRPSEYIISIKEMIMCHKRNKTQLTQGRRTCASVHNRSITEVKMSIIGTSVCKEISVTHHASEYQREGTERE